MSPVLFTLGGVEMHSWGILTALGFTVTALLTMLRAREENISTNRIADLMFYGALVGIPAARFAYITLHPEGFPTTASWFNPRFGGVSFYGGVVAVIPMTLYLVRRYRLNPLQMADLFAPAVAIGHAIQRLGCYGTGCCYGAPSSSPWAVIRTHPLVLGPHNIGIHPSQLYEAIGLALLCGLMTWRRSKRAFVGEIVLLYAFGYALLRVAVEATRGDPSRGWILESVLGQRISIGQGLAVACAIATVGLWVAQRKRS